ncbi:hypothetical protein ACP4OV_029500 [Aristida adscensionis]
MKRRQMAAMEGTCNEGSRAWLRSTAGRRAGCGELVPLTFLCDDTVPSLPPARITASSRTRGGFGCWTTTCSWPRSGRVGDEDRACGRWSGLDDASLIGSWRSTPT